HARCRLLGLALEPHGADLLRSPVSRLRHARRRPPITDACLVPRGDLFLAAVVCSPLDLLARQYLFTAEAVEQMLVGLVAAHLLVLGTPEKAVRRLRLDRLHLSYYLAWVTGMAALSMWYLPRLLNATLASDAVRC